MGLKCCIPGCLTGSPGNPKPKDISLFSFPNEGSPARDIWIKIVSKLRINWKINNSSRICSKHFRPEDYGKISADKRARSENSSKLQSQLTSDAYPSIFPDLPSYLNLNVPKKRNGNTSADQRTLNEYKLLEDIKTINNLDDIRLKLDAEGHIRDELSVMDVSII